MERPSTHSKEFQASLAGEQEGLSLLCSHNASKGRAARALTVCPKTPRLSRTYAQNRAEGLYSLRDLIQHHSCPCKQIPEKQRGKLSSSAPAKQAGLAHPTPKNQDGFYSKEEAEMSFSQQALACWNGD